MKAILEGFSYYSGRLCRCHKNKSSTPRATWIVNGRIPAFDRIFGDQLEAIAYLLQSTDERGSFTDGERNRKYNSTIEKGRREYR